MKRSATCPGLLLLAAALGCTRLPERPTVSAMQRDTLPDSVSVPASWGNLVAVTVNPAFTDVEQLWFQDSTRRIHLVIYDVGARQLRRVSPLITRR